MTIRKLGSGRYLAVVQIGKQRRTATLRSRHDAEEWTACQELPQADTLTVQHTPSGMSLHIPEAVLTMDLAAQVETAVRTLISTTE